MSDMRSDIELVAGLQQGDASAFSELLTRYTEKVNHLALRITRNQEDAEEILQDVFVTVFKKVDRFEGKSAFSSWLYRITVNTAFMKLRKRKQSQAVSLDEVGEAANENFSGKRSDTSDVNFISSRHELRAQLDAAIEKLPDEYKAIFILRDVDGLSNQEVGEILNLSVPAVKSRLHRSRLMLRKKLQRFYDDYSTEQIFYGKNKAEVVEMEYLKAA